MAWSKKARAAAHKARVGHIISGKKPLKARTLRQKASIHRNGVHRAHHHSMHKVHKDGVRAKAHLR